MSRPSRTKRARIAFDGTVLSSEPNTPTSAKVASPSNSSRPTPSSSRVKRQRKEVTRGPDSGEEVAEGEVRNSDAVDKAINASPLGKLDDATLLNFFPEARERVLSILTGRLPPPRRDNEGHCDGSECVGLKEQWHNLHAAVRGSMRGEGNSALMIGTRGCGKTLLLESVLRAIETEGGVDSSQYHLVKLDGAIQATDGQSMRELARQLVKKGAIQLPAELESSLNAQEEAGVAGAADEDDEDSTDAAERRQDLHAGDDASEEQRQAVASAVLSSLANTTSTILTLLSSGADAKSGLPLIITLSDFDLYTSRPRQALLYVLLDAVQAGSYTPGLCVVGMTTRLDTTDLLEKRVKSRFGGRTINVWPEDNWIAVLRQTLSAGLVDEQDSDADSFNKAWRKEVDSICKNKSVKDLLEDVKSTSNVVRTLFKCLYPLIASTSPSSPSLLSPLLQQSSEVQSSPIYSVLSDLTIPELALLIASKQLLNRDREVFNFEMCFDELRRFVGKVELDRLGAASSAPSSTMSGDPQTPKSNGSRTAPASIGLGWQALTDRRRVMMAFISLLQLELFQPEATLNTLSMSGPTSTANKASQTVRNEYLRVKCAIFPQDIINAAKVKSRREAMGVHMVQWAASQG